jgi:exodeoxyribonuclease V
MVLSMKGSPLQGEERQFSNVQQLSEDQKKEHDAIVAWFSSVQRNEAFRRFVLAGYAGTGKTTLTGHVANELQNNARGAFLAPTGKASTTLNRSLASFGVDPYFCGTVHSFLYRPLEDTETGEVHGWEQKNIKERPDLIVVDEASMLAGEQLRDLLDLNIPLLAVGDHGQLPPVGEDLSIMAAPDGRLEKIHRQAYGNPIITFASAVRSGNDWRSIIRKSRDERLQYVDKLDIGSLLSSKISSGSLPMVLCGTNRTRAMINSMCRAMLGKTDVVSEGDQMICLRNRRKSGRFIANGFRGIVEKVHDVDDRHVVVSMTIPDEQLKLVNVRLCRRQLGLGRTISKYEEAFTGCRSWEQAGLLFDFGYALTVHKAQGSQADDVLLIVEDFQGDESDMRRWVYTGVTRSSKRLTVAF